MEGEDERLSSQYGENGRSLKPRPRPPSPLLPFLACRSLNKRMAFDSLRTIPTQRRPFNNASDLELASMEEGSSRPGPSSPPPSHDNRPRSNSPRRVNLNARELSQVLAASDYDGESTDLVLVSSVRVLRVGSGGDQYGGRAEGWNELGFPSPTLARRPRPPQHTQPTRLDINTVWHRA